LLQTSVGSTMELNCAVIVDFHTMGLTALNMSLFPQ